MDIMVVVPADSACMISLETSVISLFLQVIVFMSALLLVPIGFISYWCPWGFLLISASLLRFSLWLIFMFFTSTIRWIN